MRNVFLCSTCSTRHLGKRPPQVQMSDLFFMQRYLFRPQESAAQLSASTSIAWNVPFARVIVRGRNSWLTFRRIRFRASPHKVFIIDLTYPHETGSLVLLMESQKRLSGNSS
jgi:hypothetical protein